MGSAFLFAKDYLPDVEEPTPVTPFGRLRWPGDAAPATAPAAPNAPAIDPEDVFGLPGGKQLPGEASPLNALPPVGDSPQSLLSGPPREGGLTPSRETTVTPFGPISVDRSKGLSGQAWLDSQRGRSAPSSFDAMVAGPSEPAAQSATLEPGSERTYGFSGNGTIGGLLGDIQAQGLLGARDEASGGRELADLGRRAQASTFEELIADPFAKERLQGELESQRVSIPMLLKGKIDKMSEQERRTAYRDGAASIEERFYEEMTKAGADPEARARAESAREQAREALREAFGIGARMTSNALYQGNSAF